MSLARADLSAPRPWRAVPTDPARRDSDWQVVAPARHGRRPVVVASLLSEEDARLIAAAPRMRELLQAREVLARRTEALEAALERLAQGGLDPAGAYEAYRQARDAQARALEQVDALSDEPVPF